MRGNSAHLYSWRRSASAPPSCSSAANFVALNTADNWLRLFLGVGMLGLGLALARRVERDNVVAA